MPESEIVFGVNECSPVLDSYSAVDAMSNKEDLLSLNPTLLERQRTAWPMPVGVAGFKQLTFEVDAVATNW